MDRIKKDFIVFYLARNAVATFVITMCAFVYDFINYFNMTVIRAVIKIFSDNFYTTVYFLLLWILNYLLFELYKIVVDTLRKGNKKHAKLMINGKETVAYGILLPFIILVVLLLVEFNRLFRVDFILLALFMLLRSFKEEIKYRKK